MKRDIPLDLAPGATIDLEGVLEVPHPGPFESQIHLYYDDFGLREQILTVKGTASEK